MSDLVERLRSEGAARYHDKHPFHARMHEGTLTRRELGLWVENRYYYQTRIPIKDAIIVSKSEDPAFRRTWLHRIVDHDGAQEGEGGLALWLRLAEGVGLPRERVRACANVLPGVRAACDRYVALVRERSLVEAVASSLTEFFAPDLMSRRIEAWQKHYPWVDPAAIEYFRTRVTRARRDSGEAIDFVVREARTTELQDRCVQALVDKTKVLWDMLDAIESAAQAKLKLAARARIRGNVLLTPEHGIELNGSALEIVRLLDGSLNAAGIVDRLAEQYGQRERIAADVDALLCDLERRGLVE